MWEKERVIKEKGGGRLRLTFSTKPSKNLIIRLKLSSASAFSALNKLNMSTKWL